MVRTRCAISIILFFILLCDSQRVQVIYEGQNIAFYCNATGISASAPVHYQWELDNRVIIASDDKFSLINITKADEGEYKCTATQFIDKVPVVAVESTYISVRRADSIITQDVEEGILVRILCNVTGNTRPNGAGPLRYEWRNPNGTLVGSQWKLELGHIKLHESGVYVCHVSYELDKRQMSTSSATRINVLKRAGVTFPGLNGNVLEALETGDILQECRVVSSKPAEYRYQWFGPNGNPISNTAILQKDYVLRPQDEGIYTCLATPTQSGLLPVESGLIVTITPLRFTINTVAEDLKIGGFTRRRISIMPQSNPHLTTRETFTYQWLTPDGAPVPQGSGPDMHVTFRSPQDFGRYYVQVRGLNSGYKRDLISYITLDDGIVEPTYSVVIREVSGPLYFNSRLELECAPNPPNPAARINWLGPDGVVVSDSSNLVFDKFQYHNQGRYTCQILLPNQVILRQSVELTASGSVTDAPGPSGRYTISIIQTPLTFRYNDAVQLRCVVQPDPPHVQFEWQKDGQIIGRTSELSIPNFTPFDVGRYQCVARIEGYTDITSNATILPKPDESGPVELIMRPGVIYQPAFTPLRIECISQRPNLQPIARFANGMPVESDNRFTVSRPDSQRLVITAPGGLSNVYNGHRIQCVLPGFGDRETTVYIVDRCISSESQCRNRECVPTSKLCDGRPDCSDRSDEGADFCNAGVTVSPTRIVVRPGEAFTLQCQSLIPGQMPYARFVYSRVNVEQDPRFRTERTTREQLVIKAPHGLDLSDNNTRIECYFPDEGTRIAIINIVDLPCPPQSFFCMDGSCIPSSGYCDGIRQCADGSDELVCKVTCLVPNIACPSGECIDPSRRCDGYQDCRDGFDEQGCPSRCPSPKYECSSGECIAPGKKCDGRRDCADGSDERDCPSTCFPPNIQCPSGECIPSEKRCDGRVDCQDGFDEQGCRTPCLPPNTYCPSGECIRPEARCDGHMDCRDGSDERDCHSAPSFRPTEPVVRPYGTLEIECVSDKPGVRPQVTLLNGSSVEQLSRFIVNYPSTERIVVQLHDVTERDRGLVFRCSYPTGETSEAQVVIDSPCGPTEMMCRNRMCIPFHYFCNGAPDCPDGSDEQQPHCESSCHSNQYKCASGECIDSIRRCDGRHDCYDGSDEAGCPRRCQPDQYECNSGECIDSRRRCNGVHDCYDGSDETECPSKPIIRPERPIVRPYGSIEIECRSNEPGVRPELRINNGTLVEQLPRFEVLRPQPEVIIARAKDLTERDRNMIIQCVFPTGEISETEIVIDSPCSPYEWMCRDGQCVPQSYFCNGRQECRDGSDEQPPHCEVIGCQPFEFQCGSRECIDARRHCDGQRDCRDGSDESGCVVRPIIRPERPIIRPYGSVEIECRSNQPHIRPELRINNGTPVEQLPRFQVIRPQNEVVIARINELTERDRNMVIQCVYPTGEMSETEIVIDSPCSPYEWMCRDGQCVPQSYFCNGRQDCHDGSDERLPHCAMQVIRPVIRPERPVVRPYGSVEIECRSNQLNVRPELRINNGTPVEQLARFVVTRPQNEVVVARITDLTERDQNMVIQCVFPTGEMSETVIVIDSPCGPNEWMCRDGQCIPQSYFCNGRQECRDGSDEQLPHCEATRCQTHEFRCMSGECIDARRRCDRQPDCYDRSDEEGCEYGCQPYEFTCHSGECIETESRCDGRRDCYDGSDEQNCETRCQPHEFRCASGECIEADRRCDRRRDCYDGSDEDGCETRCQPHEFHCASGECIEADRRCDRRRDCYDGSDEDGCETRCQPHEFRCASGECIEADRRCDRRRDCYDGSDEDGCETRCQSHEFRCGSGECIDARRRCDRQRDCYDGSDEESCVQGPIIRPERPVVRPYSRVEFECRSDILGVRPQVTLVNGTELERLPRFQVTRPSHEVVLVRIDNLTESDRDLVIRCSYPTGESSQTIIIIDSPCGPDEVMCRTGSCVPAHAVCDGRPDCPDGSDEKPPRCYTDLITSIEIRPTIIRTIPYEPFRLDCISHNPAIRPIGRLSDGRSIEEDKRFQLNYITPSHLQIQALYGLTERDDLTIICVFPGVGNRSAMVNVSRPCPPGQYQCQDGRCLPSSLFCNGQPDCADQSDESDKYCTVDITVTPGVIRTKPFEVFHFECSSSIPGTKPAVFFDGIPIESDRRFVLIRPTTERVIVRAPQGVPDHGGHIFRCISVTGSSKEVLVRVETECPPGQYQCSAGHCIPPRAICDGRPDCSDHSDENPAYCALDLLIIPGYIYTQPSELFEFVCESRAGGSPPHVKFADGRPLETDPRFTVSRPTPQRVVVRAEDGVSAADHNTRMICYTAEGLSREILVHVEPRCPAGQRQCDDGLCLPESYFCNGRVDCADGSDEKPTRCAGDVVVKPGVINVKVFESFQFECTSSVPGVTPQVSFDGEPVDGYAQFTVSRPSPERVIVNTPYGIAEPGIHLFSCTTVTGTSREVLVKVEDGCSPTEFRCRDGTCIPRESVCDRRMDCADGSDEAPPDCPEHQVQVNVRFTPGEIRVQPGRRVRLECRTDTPGTSPTVKFTDGRPITEDSRFVITQPNRETVVIEVPYGFEASTRRVVLICESPTGDRKTATIHVDQSCQIGQRRCPGGDCIFVGQFCDGIEHCPDGYDERPENCAICDPISIPCQPVNGIQPTITHFQLHWLCDGENDCGNGFDELNCRNNTRHLDPNCGSTHYQCTSAPHQHIPFSYWCDGTMDCRGGEDEQDCARPAIVESGKREPYKVRPGDTLILECEASGIPPPMVIWRFNWGCLPDAARTRIEVVPGRSDCRGSRSRLTITGFRAGDDGIYNCEALAYSHRAMSQDILVLLDD